MRIGNINPTPANWFIPKNDIKYVSVIEKEKDAKIVIKIGKNIFK